MTAQERLYTADDLLNMTSDDHLKVELVEGVLVEMPPASAIHTIISALLVRLPGNFVADHQLEGYVTDAQGGYQLAEAPDTVRAPDAAYISKARVPELTSTYFKGAPDLAIKVISPNDKAMDLQEKIDGYLRGGSRLVWSVFYSKMHRVIVHTSVGSRTLHENDTLDGGDVLPGFSLPVREIFAALES